MKANQKMIELWAKRNKCFMCKKIFESPFILPVVKQVRDKFQPNFNTEAILHLYDTHGIPDNISRKWIIGSIYGKELNLFGAYGLERLYDE